MSTTRSAVLSGFKRYLPLARNGTTQNNGNTAFAYSGSGLLTTGPDQTHPLRIFPIGKALLLTLIPFGSLSTGASANNATFDYRVYFVHRVLNDLNEPSALLMRTYAGGGSVTLGTQTGSAGLPVLASEHFADTITWTASGVGTTPPGPLAVGETAFNEGVSSVYAATAADNMYGMIYIPCALRATGIVIDVDSTSANSQGNFLVMTDEI